MFLFLLLTAVDMIIYYVQQYDKSMIHQREREPFFESFAGPPPGGDDLR
jgi:hypothetical protein